MVKILTEPDGKTTDEVELAAIRKQLNELRRQVRRLNRPALEECLSLAVALSNPKTKNQ